MFVFEVGTEYSKRQIRKVIGHPEHARGGPLDTGVSEHNGEFLIFANVGTEGRTGHDYDNRWEGSLFRWSHKRGSTIYWPSVQRLLSAERIHMFWRTDNQRVFKYAGLARADSVFETSPVGVLWSFSGQSTNVDYDSHPGEVSVKEYKEGAVRHVWVNVYERDRTARETCLAYYGPGCTICGFEFEERYGTIGKGFMHVHHLVPLSEIRRTYVVDPIKDLRPVCPNCHAIVHRRRPPFTIEEVRMMLRARS